MNWLSFPSFEFSTPPPFSFPWLFGLVFKREEGGRGGGKRRGGGEFIGQSLFFHWKGEGKKKESLDIAIKKDMFFLPSFQKLDKEPSKKKKLDYC